MNTEMIGEELKKCGFTFYSGVPCSFLKDFINYAINSCDYVAATNEGEAIAIAAGAFLCEKKAVVLMQNSGLSNAISPLVSLTYPFRIPVLGFVSLRGEAGVPDEPQHELMGKITAQMLDLMEIKWEYLSNEDSVAKQQIRLANHFIEQNQPFFFIVRQKTFGKVALQKQPFWIKQNMRKVTKSREDELSTRYEALSVINALKDRDTVQLATTGKTGRELYEIEDARNNLYMVGSMGCVSSLGLGMALTKKEKDIIVLDGDGSLLMRMGSLATNGYYGPSNMLHILFDNHVHSSTGGQRTVSHNVDFVEIAAACGYTNAQYIHDVAELEQSVAMWKKEKELTFLYVRISKDSKENLPRPTVKPYEVKERITSFLAADPD